MRKLLTIIAAMIISDAYGAEPPVYWLADSSLKSASSCNLGGNITKPADPEKTGFKFIGWKEDSGSSLKNSTTCSSKYPQNTGDGSSYWTTTFSWGTVKGAATCYGKVGYIYDTSNDSTAYGNTVTDQSTLSTSGVAKTCWCNITHFNNVPITPFVWEVSGSSNTASSCTQYCSWYCSKAFCNWKKYRNLLMGLN